MSYRNDAAMREQLAQVILANCRITLKLRDEGRPSDHSAVQDAPGRDTFTGLSGEDRHEKV